MSYSYYGICIYCGKSCGRNDERVKPKGNRQMIYFHRKCYEAEQAEIREKRNRRSNNGICI